MKKYIIVLLVSLAVNAFAQTEKYSRVKIYADQQGMIELARAGVAVDHGQTKKGVWFVSDFSASEILVIKNKGYKYEVLIDDVKQFYKDQNRSAVPKSKSTLRSTGCPRPPVYTTPSGFTLGSMGGYFTYEEVLWHMDNLATLYPDIVKTKTAVGANTIEGRPVYWMKISDNPETDEAEPEVFYNSEIHAREPASVSQLIMYMYYLCENYATNAEVKYLVDNTEMYFVPLANPDGYVYNETTDPEGGGLWRKNRKNNGDGTYGVDVNRNFGYNWGYDDSGSSPFTFSDTYRGTAAFSEIESQNLRDFCNAHHFKLALNNHTYGDCLVHPWDFGTTPDDTLFKRYADDLTQYNRYIYGTDLETVGYPTNGTIDDWQYGDTTARGKVLGMTPEAGGEADGFWPPSTRIIDLCKENIWPNLQLAHLVLKYAVATDDESKYVPSAGYFHYRIKRLGLDDSATYTVSIAPIGSSIASVGPPKNYSTLHLLEEVEDSIAFSLGTLSTGDIINYELIVSNGLYSHRDTLTKKYGSPVIVFASDGNSMSGWTSDSWDLSTSIFHSGTASITDSPDGWYNANTTTSIQTTDNMDLTNALSAELTFWARWEIEKDFDYTHALISTNGGASWEKLCGEYTRTGSDAEGGGPVYDSYKREWVKEKISLDDYIGSNVKIGFELTSDEGVQADGFYFDDLKVEKLALPDGITQLNKEGIFISQNIPNPANGYTYINYQSVTGTEATLLIYDCYGQLVKQQTAGESGSFFVNTSEMNEGVYFYRLKAGDFISGSMKMVIVR